MHVNFNTSKLAILFIVMMFSSAVFGQGNEREHAEAAETERMRPNLLRELGLSPEQVQQIRLLNTDLRPVREAARLQLRTANRELDQAIYAEIVDESLVAERLARYQAAQAELARINFDNELEVRKILTPEQLIKFRDVRRRFAEAREQLQQRRQENIRQRQPERDPGPGQHLPGGPQRPSSKRP